MLLCSLIYILANQPESYTLLTAKGVILNLSVMPEIVEVGGTITGFVYLTDINGRPVIADDDVTIEILSDGLLLLSDNATIARGEFYTSFEAKTITTGEARIKVRLLTSIEGHIQESLTKVVKVVGPLLYSSDTSHSSSVSDTQPEGIRLELSPLTGDSSMLTHSELPLLLSVRDKTGRAISMHDDTSIRLSYSAELITLEYRPIIPKGSSYTLVKVRSYELTGIAYVRASMNMEKKELVTSIAINITSDRATSLKIYILPPIVSKGFMPIDLLITLVDSNGVPVVADKDFTINITTTSPSLFISKGNYTIKKGEHSLSIREYAVFTSTGTINVSVSAPGLIGDSTTLTVVEPLYNNSPKSNTRVLKLFLPEHVASNSTTAGVYQLYAVEIDDDDCPRLDDISVDEERHVGTIDLSSIIDACRSEGYTVHNIDLLKQGELYPIADGIRDRAYVTTSSVSAEIISNVTVNNVYGMIAAKGNGYGDVTITANIHGASSTSSVLHVIDKRLPYRTIATLHKDFTDYHLFVTIVEYGGRPVITDMKYIVNPLGIILDVKGSSYVDVKLRDSDNNNNINSLRRLDIVPIGVNVDSRLATYVDTNLDPNSADNGNRIKPKIMLPFTTIVPVKDEYKIGYVQLFKENSMIYPVTEDVVIKLVSSSNNISVSDAIVRKGSSYAQFTITLNNIMSEESIKISVVDDYSSEVASVSFDVILLEFEEPYIVAYDKGESIEIRMYAKKDTSVVWGNTNNNYTYLHKDSRVTRVDENGFYASAVVRDVLKDQPIYINALLYARGYKPYPVEQLVNELLPYKDAGDHLSISVRGSTIYAGDIGFIDVIVSDVNGNTVSAVKVDVYGGDGVEVLTNNVYTNDDGIARIFLRAVKDSTIYIDADKVGYIKASIEVPISTVKKQSDNSNTIMDMTNYMFIGTSVGGIASILIFLWKRKARVVNEEEDE